MYLAVMSVYACTTIRRVGRGVCTGRQNMCRRGKERTQLPPKREEPMFDFDGQKNILLGQDRGVCLLEDNGINIMIVSKPFFYLTDIGDFLTCT